MCNWSGTITSKNLKFFSLKENLLLSFQNSENCASYSLRLIDSCWSCWKWSANQSIENISDYIRIADLSWWIKKKLAKNSRKDRFLRSFHQWEGHDLCYSAIKISTMVLTIYDYSKKALSAINDVTVFQKNKNSGTKNDFQIWQRPNSAKPKLHFQHY